MLVLEQLINDFFLFILLIIHIYILYLFFLLLLLLLRHYTIEIGHNAPLRLPVNSSTVDLELRLSVVSKS